MRTGFLLLGGLRRAARVDADILEADQRLLRALGLCAHAEGLARSLRPNKQTNEQKGRGRGTQKRGVGVERVNPVKCWFGSATLRSHSTVSRAERERFGIAVVLPVSEGLRMAARFVD